ncbi:Fasciclin-like arabinogalactan protein 19 [Bienertia sinuspersici]
MAEKLKPSNTLIIIIIYLTFSLIISTSIADLTLRDLETAIFALRANGFDLFANSIAVSELSFQVLTHTFNSSSSNGGIGRHGFTFLAPPNSVLFSLDMSTDAFTYIHSLRFHVIPRHFSFSELLNISRSSKPHLETLVPGHVLFVASSGRRVVSIDGVRVSFPDLYLSSDIAVHGLDGILVSSNEEFFHRLDSVASPPLIHSRGPAPSIDDFSPKSERVLAPIDAFSPNFEGIPPFSQQFGGILAPSDAFSPQFVGFPPFSQEIEGTSPLSQELEGIPPYMQEFEGIPVPMDAFSPEISEARSPIDAFSPESGANSANNDSDFTGGSFNSISVPPIGAYSPESDGAPTPSPSIEHSASPTYAKWSGAEFLSPNMWLPDWSVQPPPPFTVGESQENQENVNRKKMKTRMKMKHHHHHHLDRGH